MPISSHKAALVKFIDWLPPGLRRAAIERAAARDDAYDIFQALGRRYGITDIRISGRYGLIEGSIDDGSVLASYGRRKIWAAETNDVFVDFFARRSGGTYLDIGANIGLTTIPVARNGAVSCLAFEPEPVNYGYLVQNVGRNCIHGNVDTFDIALFDRQTVVDFELSKQNRGDHRIRTQKANGRFDEQSREVIQVRAERLDDLVDLHRLEPPLAAKIDTQGAECHVIAGGQVTLGKAELMAFEYWPYGFRRAGGDVDFLISFVERHFSVGAVVAGDRTEQPDWQPIRAVIGTMTDLARTGAGAPYAYHDVFVRK